MKTLSFEQHDSIEIGFEVTSFEDKINISCTNDSCGDSETGFGATVDIDLTIKEVLQLRNFLNTWLEEIKYKKIKDWRTMKGSVVIPRKGEKVNMTNFLLKRAEECFDDFLKEAKKEINMEASYCCNSLCVSYDQLAERFCAKGKEYNLEKCEAFIPFEGKKI